MTAREQLAHAKRLAKEAHAGQADRGGHPYVEHLSAVASWCESDVEKTVAWLHDILEDTSVDRKRLLEEGFSEEVVTAVELLTKRYYPGFDYREYLENIRR
ncbi:MAG: HD domain-containing protein, partial [Lachnospiraceae bacterium]|nr:HD domain-containing protein [Lachnospiraceae bacterium]